MNEEKKRWFLKADFELMMVKPPSDISSWDIRTVERYKKAILLARRCVDNKNCSIAEFESKIEGLRSFYLQCQRKSHSLHGEESGFES